MKHSIRIAVRKFFIFLMSAAICAVPKTSAAGISTIQPFHFGDYIIADNNSVQTITVNPSGTTSHSSGIIEITPTAQPGIYDIDGLPPNTAIASITVTDLGPLAGPMGGNQFSLGAFQTSYGSTDGAGVARITLGGTASTTGNGNGYPDQTYNATIQLDINF